MKKLLLTFLLSCNLLCAQLLYSSGNVLSKEKLQQKSEITKANYGDDFYYSVDANFLPEFYKIFVTSLKNTGLDGWTNRYDCNHLSSLYISVVQAHFAARNLKFVTNLQETLAMGEIWYTRSIDNKEHSIVIIYSNLGLIYVEPATGERIFITDREKDSIYFCKW